MKTDVRIIRYSLNESFATSRDAIAEIPVIEVKLTDSTGISGRGEAAGVDYAGETVESMTQQIQSIQKHLNDDLSPNQLQKLLPAGGARNAIDCALWDLMAKRQRPKRIWDLLEIPINHPILTCYTIGLGNEQNMRKKTREARHYPVLKVKVDSHQPLEQLHWVMSEHPSAQIIMDANASFDAPLLIKCLKKLQGTQVVLIEQPLAPDDDEELQKITRTIPIAADESCVDEFSLPTLAGRYDAINIKLDKCGGLTAALQLQQKALSMGFSIMVGNMCGSSLAMAPGWLIAQSAQWVDLDGPLLQQTDVDNPIQYQNGIMSEPTPELWG